MSIKLGADEMRYIALFEGLTGAKVHDCMVEEDGRKVIFVVGKGEIGRSIGKGGNKVKFMRRVIGRRIEVVEHSPDPVEFVKTILTPIEVKGVRITERDGKKIAEVHLSDKRVGGHRGKIMCAKKLVLRHHGIQDIEFT